MNDAPKLQEPDLSAKAAPRTHFWDDSWIGVFILMLVAAALGGLLSRLWPGGDGLLATPAGEMSEKVAALEARVLQLTNSQSTSPAADLGALRVRVSQLEDRLKTAESSLGSRGTGAPVALLSFPPGADAATKLEASIRAVQELQARLASLEISGKMNAAAGVAAGVGTAAGAFPAAEIQPLKESLTKTADALTALSGRVDGLQTKLGAMPDPAPMVASVRTDLEMVSTRIAKIEQADLPGSARRAAQGAAVASLTRAAQSGQPFKAELEMMEGLAPGEPALKGLTPYAARGVPVLSNLQSTFAAQADRAVAAEREAQSGQGLDRLWSGVASVVSVRATGTPNGNDTASILARAETKLKAGDLAAALTEAQKLQGPAKAAMSPWLQSAQARTILDAALSALNARIVESLSQSAALATPAASPATGPAPTPAVPAATP